MKAIFLLIFSFFSLKIAAQDLSGEEKIIDSMLLSKINQYRKENGLEKIIFSPKADSLSKFHDNYMINSNYVGHVEILGKDTIQPGTRINNENKYAIENVSGGRLCEKTSINGVLYETVKQIKQSNKYLNDFISNLILSDWKSSKLHNKNILNNKIHKGAVSIKFDFEKSVFVADFIAYQ